MKASPLVEALKFSDLCNPTPRQVEFFKMTDRVPFTLYGGARGGGKSFALRWCALRFLLKMAGTINPRTGEHFYGVRVGIFCEDYPTLKDRQINRAYSGRMEDRLPAWMGTWNLSEHEFRLHPEYGGGVICFRNLDDPSKYQSTEFAAIFVDELTKNLLDVFNLLRGSRRWPGMEHTPFVAATNPGSIGHSWVKDVFVDKAFLLDDTKALKEVYGVEAFGYVKATAYDNPHNSAAYLKELQSLPERLRKAFLDGNWDVFEGQAFSEWNSEVHVVPNGIRHLKGWRWMGGLDWGMRRGAYVLMAIGPDGRKEIVTEVYFKNYFAYDAAKMIFLKTQHFPTPEQVLYDDQMDQQQGVGVGKTLRSEFERGMLDHFGGEMTGLMLAPKLFAASKGKGSRKIKYDLMHKCLKWIDRRFPMGHALAGLVVPWCRPALTVQERCRHFIRTLPALPVDAEKPEDDVDTKAEDHLYDAACNVLLAEPDVIEPEDRPFVVGKHPGMNAQGRKRNAPPQRPSVDDDEDFAAATGQYQEGYRMPRPDDYTVQK